MSKKITIRLKQYGDKGAMEDVGEIVVPDDTPPLATVEWVESREKFYRVGKVSVTFADVTP